MKTRSLVSITPLSMPRKSLIISILLLVGFGFMLVGGWSSHAWAASVGGKVVRISVDQHDRYPNGRVFIELDPVPGPVGHCVYTKMMELDTNDESYKSLLTLAMLSYTTGHRV